MPTSILCNYLFLSHSCPNGGKTSAQTIREFGSMWRMAPREDFHLSPSSPSLCLSPLCLAKLTLPSRSSISIPSSRKLS